MAELIREGKYDKDGKKAAPLAQVINYLSQGQTGLDSAL